jgi:hypothetical protein
MKTVQDTTEVRDACGMHVWKTLLPSVVAVLFCFGVFKACGPENRARIDERLVPIVDDAWIAIFPEDAGLRGEAIETHHVRGLPLSGHLPKTRHQNAHLPKGSRENSGGPGSGLPLYPPASNLPR